MKCCNQEVGTLFCPDCGTMNNGLPEVSLLKYRCVRRKAAIKKAKKQREFATSTRIGEERRESATREADRNDTQVEKWDKWVAVLTSLVDKSKGGCQ